MARFTRYILLVAVAAAMLLVPAVASAAEDSLLAPEEVCPGQTDLSLPDAAQEQVMLCMHRYAREKAGVRGISESKKLQTSSARKAGDIKRCKQFSHDACGRDAFYWQRRVGFMRGNYGVAENLAMGSGQTGTVRGMMNAWLSSSGHRQNLLNGSYDQMGVSVVTGRYRGYGQARIWVAHFGYRH